MKSQLNEQRLYNIDKMMEYTNSETNKLSDEYIYGKQISEAKYMKGWTYNHKTKLFEEHIQNSRYRRAFTYTELKYQTPFTNFPNYYKACEWFYLYEGLVRSLEPMTMFSKLQEFEDINLIIRPAIEVLGLNDEDRKKKTPMISFYILKDIEEAYQNKSDEDVVKYIDILLNFIQTVGYFIANKTDVKIPDNTGNMYNAVLYQLHPKFIIEVTNTVYEKYNGILYHITTLKNWRKIKKTGFIPKNSGLYKDQYPERVYFFAKNTSGSFRAKAEQMFKDTYDKKAKESLDYAVDNYNNGYIKKEKLDYYQKQYDERGKFVVIKIDLKKKNMYSETDIMTHYRFFDDPRTPGGIFTYENIDPRCLELYEEFDFAEK